MEKQNKVDGGLSGLASDGLPDEEDIDVGRQTLPPSSQPYLPPAQYTKKPDYKHMTIQQLLPYCNHTC